MSILAFDIRNVYICIKPGLCPILYFWNGTRFVGENDEPQGSLEKSCSPFLFPDDMLLDDETSFPYSESFALRELIALVLTVLTLAGCLGCFQSRLRGVVVQCELPLFLYLYRLFNSSSEMVKPISDSRFSCLRYRFSIIAAFSSEEPKWIFR